MTDTDKEKQFTPASRSVRKTRLSPEPFQSLISSHATTVLTNRNTENIIVRFHKIQAKKYFNLKSKAVYNSST